jgi:hypothetical protein
MDDNILFIISADDNRGPLGIFSTIGLAVRGAEHVLKGDRVQVESVVIGCLPSDDFAARVDGSSGVSIFIRIIEVDECHSIDGIITL